MGSPRAPVSAVSARPRLNRKPSLPAEHRQLPLRITWDRLSRHVLRGNSTGTRVCWVDSVGRRCPSQHQPLGSFSASPATSLPLLKKKKGLCLKDKGGSVRGRKGFWEDLETPRLGNEILLDCFFVNAANPKGNIVVICIYYWLVFKTSTSCCPQGLSRQQVSVFPLLL